MNPSEIAVLAALHDVEAIDVLVSEGLDIMLIPTEELRPLVHWALKQYIDSGRRQAPSREAMLEEWGQYISDSDIELPDLDDEHDTPEWAVGMLKANHVQTQANEFQLAMAREMSEAHPQDRVGILAKHADNLATLALSMVPTRIAVEARPGLQDALARYHERAADQNLSSMFFGLSDVDKHTSGLHPGELGVLAAGPKTGKSMACLYISHSEFLRQRNVVLITLEMSVDETYDRLACFLLALDHTRFLQGSLTPEEVKRVEEYVNDVLLSEEYGRFHVVKPEPGQRTPEALLRVARNYDADSLVIDQLTFMEHPNEGRKKRDEVIRDKMHDLKNGLSAGRHAIPCLLAHQINRDGVKAASKSGFLSMEYLADGAEVERTADMVFGLYQSGVERQAQMMKFQTLAARRLVPKHWYLKWRLDGGSIGVLRELEDTSA